MKIDELKNKTDAELKQILKGILINKDKFDWFDFEKQYGKATNRTLFVDLFKGLKFSDESSLLRVLSYYNYRYKLEECTNYDNHNYINKIYLDGKVFIFNDNAYTVHPADLKEIEIFIENFIKCIRKL